MNLFYYCCHRSGLWVTAYSLWPQKNPSYSYEIPVRCFHFSSVTFDSSQHCNYCRNTAPAAKQTHWTHARFTRITRRFRSDEPRTDRDRSSQDRKKRKSSVRAVRNVTLPEQFHISIRLKTNIQILNSYCWKLHFGSYYDLREFTFALLHWKTDNLLRNTWSVSSIMTDLQTFLLFFCW